MSKLRKSFAVISRRFVDLFARKEKRFEKMQEDPEKNESFLRFLDEELEVMGKFYDDVENLLNEKDKIIEAVEFRQMLLEQVVKQLNEDLGNALGQVMKKDKELLMQILNTNNQNLKRKFPDLWD